MESRKFGITLALLASAVSHAAWATPQYFPGTGHCYEVIADPTGPSWTEARADAEARIWQGVHGYLACINSAEENQFVFALSLGSGVWYTSTVWEIGPWLGGFQLPASPEPAGGWSWISSEPWDYSNWFAGQPDNNGYMGQNENSLVLWGHAGTPAPTWNDYTNSPPSSGRVYGYVVEYDTAAIGACCFVHICVLLTEPDCTGSSGIYLGTGTTCDGNPCEGLTPACEMTWGAIKSSFAR
jgi:hypothetical protein